jgi:PilZ domain
MDRGDQMETTLAADRQQSGIPRARRYGIATSIRYHVGGANVWREGTIENISISGVLLCAEQALEVNTPIEMRFVLPVELQGENAAEVICRGVVVRTAQTEEPEETVKVAVRIVSSRFLRQQSGK